MNQNEQMREALRMYMSAGSGNSTNFDLQARAWSMAQQALAAPERELVRLTPSQLLEAYVSGRENHGSNIRLGIHISGLLAVQNAIMDAMIAKNGGQS